jgi:hypothetical protein
VFEEVQGLFPATDGPLRGISFSEHSRPEVGVLFSLTAGLFKKAQSRSRDMGEITLFLECGKLTSLEYGGILQGMRVAL